MGIYLFCVFVERQLVMLRSELGSVSFIRLSTRGFASRREYKGLPGEEEATKRGLSYEFHCIRVLREHNMHLIHKGQAGDKGVDFQGFWFVEHAENFDHKSPDPHMFNIIGQCKHEFKQCRPHFVKEMEGVLSRWKHKQHHGSFITREYPERMQIATKIIPMVGLMACSAGYSHISMKSFEKAKNPMIFTIIRPHTVFPDDMIPTSDQLKSCLLYWKLNPAAEVILPHLRHEYNSTRTLDGISPS